MKKTLLIAFCAIFSAVLMQSCKNNDAAIQKEVQTLVSEKVPGITVTVKDKVVTLEGTVDSEEAKLEAAGLASIKSVKSVTNNIVVKEEPKPVINPDTEIRTAIEGALSAGGFKDVKVEVMDGEVTLTGNVKKADRQKVMQIANESNPKKVNNKLTVK